MVSANSLWTVSSLQRFKLPIFALTALAACCTIYYVNTLSDLDPHSSSSRDLHRSNANRRRRRRRSAGVPPQSGEDDPSDGRVQMLVTGAQANTQALDGGETDTDGASNFSWDVEGREVDESKDGQRLLLLLYKIAEENSRKDGYVHRGVQCNQCNEHPIKGIRYHCTNCADFDLCEMCESAHTHNRQHLFLKVRIPAAHLGKSRRSVSTFYPGKPKAIIQDLRKEKIDKWCRETGYKVEEIEGYWELFRAMAGTEWPNDPDHYGLAIDRQAFNQGFLPHTSLRPAPPNLIYDRLFSYYDTNDDGVIGFDEFIKGLASFKRKNWAERLKRIFRAYDIDNDGYVDRLDFLRMFRAHFALTKELSTEIVARMQDDEDAQELVTGGQPISSGFNGPGAMHSEGPRYHREGKIRNSIGDWEIVDGMGAVDEHVFDPDVEHDSIIAENAERAHWGNSSEFPNSGQEIYNIIQRPWEQLVELMNRYALVRGEVVEEDLRNKLRRDLHVILATESLRRRVARREAVVQRAKKTAFYQGNGKRRSSFEVPMEAGGILVNPRLSTEIAKDYAEMDSSQRFETHQEALLEKVKSLDWPIDSPKSFLFRIFKLIRDGWSFQDLVQDHDGYSSDANNIRQFFLSFLRHLGDIANEVREERGYETKMTKSPKPGRSRSSSKVRFEDSLIDDDDDGSKSATSHSSRSRPLNERWGGFASSEPESDVGREILYKVTEESFNELLDPVFKLREDLALNALLDRKRRNKYRHCIVTAVQGHQNLREVKLYLEWYSRRWRQTRVHPPPPDGRQKDEHADFINFVSLMQEGKEDPLTGRECVQCAKHGRKSFVPIGTYCNHLQYHSEKPMGQPEGRRLESEKTSPAETCPFCADMGKTSWISELYCNKCGQPCARLIAEESKLRKIIEYGVEGMPSDSEDEFPGDSSDHENPISTKHRHENEEVPAASPPEVKSSENEFPRLTNVSRDETAQGSTTSSVESATEDIDSAASPGMARDPHSSVANLNRPSPAGLQSDIYMDTASYPEMAHDLHESVATFNESDSSSLEMSIASKPLDELLADSGFASVNDLPSRQPTPPRETTLLQSEDLPSRDPSPQPDPTLPQNRPSNILQTPPISIVPRRSLSLSFQPDSPLRHTPTLASESGSETLPLSTLLLDENRKPRSNSGNHVIPDKHWCKIAACLDILEAEDRERGGPGRISLEEFEEIMMGEKGEELSFLGGWVEMGAF